MADHPAQYFAKLPKMAEGLTRTIKRIDADALAAMVSGAKARAPRETGALVNGITGHMDGDTAVLEAHAIAPEGSHADYPAFVEFGHASGVANHEFFAGDGAAALTPSGGGHVAPHPFFYPATKAPLSKRWADLHSAADKLSSDIAKG